MTHEQVAFRVGYKRAAPMSLVESRKSLPAPQRVLRFAHALEVSPSELLEDVAQPLDRLKADTDVRRYTGRKPPAAPSERPSAAKTRAS